MKILRTPASVSKVTAWDHRRVAELDRHGHDILIVERKPVGDIGVLVASTAVGEFRGTIDGENAAETVSQMLLAMRLNHPALEADIVGLAASFLSQFRRKQANLRVEVVDTSTCPKFHCDTIGIRMLATCCGPMTQYQFVADPEAILSAPPGSLVFLKGRTHPTHDGGVLHRSPPVVVGEKRLVALLDFSPIFIEPHRP